MITVILSTINFLSLQQIQNSLARTSVKSPKSCHITPILRYPHWLRIAERIEYKILSLTGLPAKFSQLPDFHFFKISSLFNVLAVIAIHSTITSSSSDSPLCSSITPSLFHSRLKVYLFHKFHPRSFTSFSWTVFADYCPNRFF